MPSVRVLSLTHQADAPSGVFGEAATAAGHDLAEASFALGRPPQAGDYDAMLVFGGAMNVDEEDGNPWLGDEKRFLREVLGSRTPALGVCLGAQLLADAAGARVARAAAPEIGWYEVELDAGAGGDPVLGPLPERFTACEWHSYEFALPHGATALASSPGSLQAYRLGDRVYGIQFHAEVTADTLAGWIERYEKDPDAVAMDLDTEGFAAESRERIAEWNALGRGICSRFLETAERLTRA